MTTRRIRDQFHDEIGRLRAAYPMVHIGTWTPDDFHRTQNGPDDRGEPDWEDPLHRETARELGGELEKSGGQFWLAMRRAIAKARIGR
jgi:hypothetical protein